MWSCSNWRVPVEKVTSSGVFQEIFVVFLGSATSGDLSSSPPPNPWTTCSSARESGRAEFGEASTPSAPNWGFASPGRWEGGRGREGGGEGGREEGRERGGEIVLCIHWTENTSWTAVVPEEMEWTWDGLFQWVLHWSRVLWEIPPKHSHSHTHTHTHTHTHSHHTVSGDLHAIFSPDDLLEVVMNIHSPNSCEHSSTGCSLMKVHLWKKSLHELVSQWVDQSMISVSVSLHTI